MSRKKIGPRGPKPAHMEYLQQRRLEMKDIGLTKKELNDIIMDEWRILEPHEKQPYLERYKIRKRDYDDNKDLIKAIGVREFMEEIEQMRKSGNCPPEYEEDEVTKRIKRMSQKRKKQAKSSGIIVDLRKKARLCQN